MNAFTGLLWLVCLRRNETAAILREDSAGQEHWVDAGWTSYQVSSLWKAFSHAVINPQRVCIHISHTYQIGSADHLFQCLYNSMTSTSDVSMRDTSFIMCVCRILFIFYLGKEDHNYNYYYITDSFILF